MSDKPREFWIANDPENPDCDLYDIMGVENRPVWDEKPKCDSIHVIEKSAYDKLQAKADKLAEALERIRSGLTTEQSRVEILTKNLAHQALAEYRGEK